MNFPEINTVHLNGIRDYFGFVAIADVTGMPRPNRELIAMVEVLLAGGKKWRTGIALPESLDYEGPSTISNHGPTYTHKIVGFLADTSFATATMLQAMNGRRYVVIFQDRNDRWRVMGNSNEKGARFYCNMKISRNQEGETGYAFEFRLISRFPLPAFLFWPIENVEVYATANGYSISDLEGAEELINYLMSIQP